MTTQAISQATTVKRQLNHLTNLVPQKITSSAARITITIGVIHLQIKLVFGVMIL